jgi:Domain of unknown function (DUF4259)
MGAWGAGIFDDDFALDIKGDYEDVLGSGLSHEVATKTLMERYKDALGDAEESGVFWLALAAIQLGHGALVKDVKAKALGVIDSDSDLLRWEDSADAAKRKQVLEQLKSQLLQN